MFVDDEKGVGYASFIFAVLVFLLTLIPTNNEGVKLPEESTSEEYSVETDDSESTENQLTEVLIEMRMQNTENMLQNMEIESNNDIEESNYIEINKQYQGNLESSNDIDYFKFKVEKSGKISITFQHDKIDSGNNLWEIYLIDGKTDNEIIKYFSVGGTTKGESDAARIAAGEYYIKINPYYYYSDKYYTFKINFSEESDSYEKESNDKIDIANNININANYVGNLQTDKDVDYFKLSVKNKGKINISFQHEKLDNSYTLWEIYLLDGINDNNIITLFSKGSEAILQSDYARIPAGEYYIKIKSYYYSNKDYNFKINFESESNQFESEKNNEFGLANNIEIGKKYTGNMQTDEDIDYYCFTITETKNITLCFEHNIIDSDYQYWEVYVIDGIDDKNIMHTNVKGTESSVSLMTENIAPGNYYIKIKPYNFNNTDYTISVY